MTEIESKATVEPSSLNDFCEYCGWCCEYPQSHIEHCGGGCKYIREKYDVWFDEDGELHWKLKGN